MESPQTQTQSENRIAATYVLIDLDDSKYYSPDKLKAECTERITKIEEELQNYKALSTLNGIELWQMLYKLEILQPKIDQETLEKWNTLVSLNGLFEADCFLITDINQELATNYNRNFDETIEDVVKICDELRKKKEEAFAEFVKEGISEKNPESELHNKIKSENAQKLQKQMEKALELIKTKGLQIYDEWLCRKMEKDEEDLKIFRSFEGNEISTMQQMFTIIQVFKDDEKLQRLERVLSLKDNEQKQYILKLQKTEQAEIEETLKTMQNLSNSNEINRIVAEKEQEKNNELDHAKLHLEHVTQTDSLKLFLQIDLMRLAVTLYLCSIKHDKILNNLLIKHPFYLFFRIKIEYKYKNPKYRFETMLYNILQINVKKQLEMRQILKEWPEELHLLQYVVNHPKSKWFVNDQAKEIFSKRHKRN